MTTHQCEACSKIFSIESGGGQCSSCNRVICDECHHVCSSCRDITCPDCWNNDEKKCQICVNHEYYTGKKIKPMTHVEKVHASREWDRNSRGLFGK